MLTAPRTEAAAGRNAAAATAAAAAEAAEATGTTGDTGATLEIVTYRFACWKKDVLQTFGRWILTRASHWLLSHYAISSPYI